MLSNRAKRSRKARRHPVGGAIALLGDDQLRPPGHVVGHVLACHPQIVVFPIEEGHQVGVLLKRPGVAQVGELRVVLLASMLREPGKAARAPAGAPPRSFAMRFQSPRQRRNLLVAVFRPRRAHQLDVVEHHERQPVLLLQSPRLGVHPLEAEAGRVVNVNGGLGQPAHGHAPAVAFPLC